MFSGIIEEFATVVDIRHDRENIDFTLTCSFADELKIDQSVAHNGVCLTVVALNPQPSTPNHKTYTVTAMKETLDRTNLGLVDQTARCTAMADADGSTYFTFEYDADREMARRGYFTVDKGSVTVNGVSLTVCNPQQGDGNVPSSFQVAIIPYTFEHTNFCDIRIGSVVNLEFDILGKYIARLQQL